ncbi:hypothetical protein ACKAV7_012918 [Fusarium commune]
MDFQLAAEYTNNSFTLGEKDLPKSYSDSIYLEEYSRAVYLRRPFVQLADVLDEAQTYVQTRTNQDLRRLVLYCDTINLSEGLVVGYKDPMKNLDLRVFARKVECLDPSKAIHMHFSEDCKLEFYTKDGAAPFNVFVGDARALLFEYSVEDRSIICDGEYGQNLDYTRQSPLTEWELTIGAGGLQAKDLDFTDLKGIRMEFWCDITLKIKTALYSSGIIPITSN